jgi:two-component system, NtrC family, response regulator AtoC
MSLPTTAPSSPPSSTLGRRTGPDRAVLARAELVVLPGGAQAGPPAGATRLTLGPHQAVVADPVMIALYDRARRLARSSIPVVIHGETGTGKELVAAALHAFSPRAAGPFLALNCAAIPDSLAESELFGHARGAFTGATSARDGLLDAASGGTLFLDEIAELSPATQARLLRAIEAGEVCRVGETAARRVDVRVVCASLEDLHGAVVAGRLRRDLYFRLGAARIEVPPLRERPRDLAALTGAFVTEACARLGRPSLAVDAHATRALAAHGWPGNVRELRHVLEGAVALAADDAVTLTEADLPLTPPPAPSPPPPAGFRPVAEELEQLERRRMVEALTAAGGVQIVAAGLIGMPTRTFATKLRRYAIDPAAGR